MNVKRANGRQAILGVVAVVCLVGLGCYHTNHRDANLMAQTPFPRELERYSLADYIIEPPDVLVIDALRVVPLPPYRAAPLDSLLISVSNAFPTEPINGIYPIGTDGNVTLGATYGAVAVVGKTLNEVKIAVEKHLKPIVKDPKVVVYLGQSRGVQQVRGEHLVGPDGKVRLGVYGSVSVAGLTLPRAKAAIEAHLSRYLQAPEVALDVLAFNSKVYYIIFDGGGSGQQMLRLPYTGNDTVLDALSQARGLPPVSSTNKIWVSRPAPADAPCDQILPVDWEGITRCGRTATNYQMLPGDRIYVEAQTLIKVDTALARVFAPIERVFGITLLGTGVYTSIKQAGSSNVGSGVGGF